MTNHEMITEYLKENDLIIPAKMGGQFYKGQIWPSEISKRCRELRKQGVLISEKTGKFEVFKPVSATGVKTPNLSLRNEKIAPTIKSIDILNAKLKEIEHNTKATWENYQKLRNIKEAIRSKNEYLKRTTVDKYKDK